MSKNDTEDASSTQKLSPCCENGGVEDTEEKAVSVAKVVETKEINATSREVEAVEEKGKEGESVEEDEAVVEEEGEIVEERGGGENEEIAEGKVAGAAVETKDDEEKVESDDLKLSKIENEMDELVSQIENETSILSKYDTNESVYGGQSITIGAGKTFNAPVSVTTAGSIVEYTIEVEAYDLDVGITVQRDSANDNKQTVVKKASRIESSNPLTQKVLIRKVPCVINFLFDNEFSWFYEKKISYQITVKPPNVKKFVKERNRKVEVYLALLDKEFKKFSENNFRRITDTKKDAIERVGEIETNITKTEELLTKLQKELKETKESLLATNGEEANANSCIEKRQQERNSLLSKLEEEKRRDQSCDKDGKN